jgi:hypothetical protein
MLADLGQTTDFNRQRADFNRKLGGKLSFTVELQINEFTPQLQFQSRRRHL